MGQHRARLRRRAPRLAERGALRPPGAPGSGTTGAALETARRPLRRGGGAGWTLRGDAANRARLERRVLALRRQHQGLGLALRRLLDDAGYAGTAREAWRSVRAEFDGFARTLRSPERAENRIVSDAYLSDLGSGD